MVGYELDLRSLRGTRRTVPMVAGGALLVPMALAMGAVVVFRPGFESNTRGLTELIALDVGLTGGIIDRNLFTVLVLMALIMALVTAPVLSRLRLPALAVPEREQVPATPPPPAANEP